jgi:hypothetical protein
VLVTTLKRVIDGDRFPLSPRVMALKSILGRLEPPVPAPPPLPPVQYYAPEKPDAIGLGEPAERGTACNTTK